MIKFIRSRDVAAFLLALAAMVAGASVRMVF
jgi:hypothetical protein